MLKALKAKHFPLIVGTIKVHYRHNDCPVMQAQ